MNNEPVNKLTNCTHCRAELMYDEKRGCSYCPRCHPLQKEVAPVKEKEKNYVDVKLTEARVKELIQELVPAMIRDELENWHIRKPTEEITQNAEPVELDKHANWRSEAKELDIPMYDAENRKPRLKVDVIADIDAKLEETINV